MSVRAFSKYLLDPPDILDYLYLQTDRGSCKRGAFRRCEAGQYNILLTVPSISLQP